MTFVRGVGATASYGGVLDVEGRDGEEVEEKRL